MFNLLFPQNYWTSWNFCTWRVPLSTKCTLTPPGAQCSLGGTSRFWSMERMLPATGTTGMGTKSITNRLVNSWRILSITWGTVFFLWKAHTYTFHEFEKKTATADVVVVSYCKWSLIASETYFCMKDVYKICTTYTVVQLYKLGCNSIWQSLSWWHICWVW